LRNKKQAEIGELSGQSNEYFVAPQYCTPNAIHARAKIRRLFARYLYKHCCGRIQFSFDCLARIAASAQGHSILLSTDFFRQIVMIEPADTRKNLSALLPGESVGYAAPLFAGIAGKRQARGIPGMRGLRIRTPSASAKTGNIRHGHNFFRRKSGIFLENRLKSAACGSENAQTPSPARGFLQDAL
jgi:hypothetical protein